MSSSIGPGRCDCTSDKPQKQHTRYRRDIEAQNQPPTVLRFGEPGGQLCFGKRWVWKAGEQGPCHHCQHGVDDSRNRGRFNRWLATDNFVVRHMPMLTRSIPRFHWESAGAASSGYLIIPLSCANGSTAPSMRHKAMGCVPGRGGHTCVVEPGSHESGTGAGWGRVLVRLGQVEIPDSFDTALDCGRRGVALRRAQIV